jgi:glycosyltransferase involved in cell wall biosynthesis
VSRLYIAIIVPDGTPVEGGNWSSARRLADGLHREGHRVWTGVLADWRDDGPDVVHALNARTTALPLLKRGLEPDRLVVTWTGTDLWRPETFRADNRPLLRAVTRHAVLTPDAVEIVARRLELRPDYVRYVPPGVDTVRFGPVGPVEPLPHPLLLLPGAGRPEKGALEALALTAELVRRRPVHLAIVGPSRDQAYWDQVEAELRHCPWAAWHGVVAPADMPRWYRAAEVVINTSLTEGLSNALLEALACGRPVVARDIPGNRALLEPGQVGRLYATPDEFVEAVSDLLDHPAEGRALGAQARNYVLTHFPLTDEVGRYEDLYQAREPFTCKVD